ncbi:branched-chain amino acid ABC transporter ATP-binding protein [Porphyromonas gulae]|uniref:ABC transporter ATP-binding protein n=1 Tax=Porphyromonas gulae TaxID=111105 RepID=UPI00052D62CD|nr:ATP-binding cassette domain-containing protein [Porphyromonas gulae]KGO01946.1 branched-chain amino acid ABC transporter ATP-binding protein [Porphyromonas gulae]
MILQVKHISKAFGDNYVLDGASLSLEFGQISVLMGANGSGKTTLFNIISGFLKPKAGGVYLNGKQIKSLSPHKIARMGLSRTFQDMRLIGSLTVRENILLAFSQRRGEAWWRVCCPNRDEEQHLGGSADEILQTCFIEDVAGSLAGQISYGQQKLLNLACCLASDAPVLLLDEPVAGVNPRYRDLLAQVILGLRASGKALLIIEHNRDFIELVADKILFLNEGKISEYESYKAFRENEIVQNAYV